MGIIMNSICHSYDSVRKLSFGRKRYAVHWISRESVRKMTAAAMILAGLSFSVLLTSPPANAQSPDWSYVPSAQNPEYKRVPVILFDEGHNNFHRMNKSYYGFTKLMTADGYNVRAINGPMVADPDDDTLSDFSHQKDLARILVIANPCLKAACVSGDDNAFTDAEVAEIRKWVTQGGSLFLIFDHPPFAQVTNFASTFGIDVSGTAVPWTFFSTSGATENVLNGNSDIVAGRTPEESVSLVESFYGTGFRINASPPADVTYEPLMTVSNGYYQGMALRVGKGRVYLSGEAGMFTAQLNGLGAPWGMHIPDAPYNQQYLRNIIHWLDGRMSAVSGRVTLADGTGVAGVTIQFANQAGNIWSTATNAQGYFISPTGLALGNYYWLSAASSNFNFSTYGYLVSIGAHTVRNKDFIATPK